MKNEKKWNSSNKFFFAFTFVYRNIYIFVRKLIWKSLVYIVTFVLQFFHMANAVNEAPTPIDFADALLRPEILGNRLYNVDFDCNGLFFIFLFFREVPSI